MTAPLTTLPHKQALPKFVHPPLPLHHVVTNRPIAQPFYPAVAAEDTALSRNVAIDFVSASLPLSQLLKSEITPYLDISQPATLYAVDLSCIADKLAQFRAALPRVTPYYAVKCNPDPVIVSFLARLGMSFDCASRCEIGLVGSALFDACRPNDLSNSIIFANPFKCVEDLRFAREVNASLMTLDSVEEVYKIAENFPEAHVLLRIATDDANAQIPLSSKFGARMDEIEVILDRANHCGLNMVGVAFHVGSGCTDISTFWKALESARLVFDLATQRGIHMSVLDIGGGFPGYDGEAPFTFRELADAIRPVIDHLFPAYVRVIAEPGRYMVTEACILATQVIMGTGKHRRRYYLGDGVYGSFRDACTLKLRFEPVVLSTDAAIDEKLSSDLHGPTREAVDVISKDVWLPRLQRGDWLAFENMGAYTTSLRSRRTEQDGFRVMYIYRVAEEKASAFAYK